MFNRLYNATVTLRRAASRDAQNRVTYAVVDDGTEDAVTVEIRGRLDRRTRRTVTKDGAEKVADATFVFRRLPGLSGGALVEVRPEDLIVNDETGETYKVLGISEVQQLFGSARQVRLDLEETTEAVPSEP